MAIEKVIDIKVQGNADEAVGSLRSQLRAAQADVAELSAKFGATSQQAVEAAKRAGELKDRIGDAKSLTDAFNPDAKFKALSSSLAGVAGGFAAVQGGMALFGKQSEDVEKTLLKVQAAMALSQGLQGLGEARDSFKQLKAVAVDAFKGIKAAIGSTGIGLLVVALGTIYAYWDDIKEAVSGVSEEQKKLNAASQKNVDLEAEKLKAIGNQDNILKLQGKSEKEILDIKIKQTDEAIAANKINQQNQILNTQLAVQGAQRNYEMLKSYIDFVSIPTRFLYENAAKSINNIIDLLNKIPGVNIKGKLDEALGDKAADYIAKLGFDPEQVKAEGDKTVKASQETIDKLLNDRAGYQLSKQAIDKKAAEDEKLTDAEKREKIKKLNKEFNDEIQQSQNEFDVVALENLEAANQAKKEKQDQFREDETAAHIAFQLQNDQIIYDSEYQRNARAEEAYQKRIEQFQITTNAISSIAKSGEDLLSSIQANGIARGKAGQAAMKALALVQIGADSAIAFSKMMQGTESSAAGAASVAGPAAPAVYLSTKIAFYASGAATILANLARARSLLSGGGGAGGSGGGAAPSGGSSGTGGGAPSAPQFNVVGNSGVNQLAGIMATNEQTPVKAYVVPSDVTTGQSLDRNIIRNASLG
jgi:hypothetical protein